VKSVVLIFVIWRFLDLIAQAAIHFEKSLPDMMYSALGQPNTFRVAYVASTGSMSEISRPFSRVVGRLTAPAMQTAMASWIGDSKPDQPATGISTAKQIHDMRHGRFDASSMEMSTGHLGESQWMAKFSVHIYSRSFR
jgi:hypothetical protein